MAQASANTRIAATALNFIVGRERAALEVLPKQKLGSPGAVELMHAKAAVQSVKLTGQY